MLDRLGRILGCALRGFALRVTKGTKTFVLEQRVRGRVRRITIGPYGSSHG
jgi:hypothetical protein